MNTERHPWVGAIVLLFGRNIITTLGAVLATVSAGGFAVMAALTATAAVDSPYVGLLLFVMLPALFVLGLILVPVGVLLERIGGRKKVIDHSGRFVIDLHNGRVRRAVIIVCALTVLNIVGVGALSYESVHYMESEEFCGTACHTPMEPEFTAYQHSPHSNIKCVECHVGPGVEWLVRSKMAGVRQLAGVITGNYSRPIPPAGHEMRNAFETCAACHDPAYDEGSPLVVKTKYSEDEANTPVHSALLMRVGSANAGDATIHGWHLSPGRDVWYLPSEEGEEAIPYVRVKEADGAVKHYASAEYKGDGAALPENKLRRMDCIDCHNRPAHQFQSPGNAIDLAMASGAISRELPSIKEASLAALTGAAESGNAADVEARLTAFYAERYPDLPQEQKELFAAAVKENEAIFARNIFPDMKVTWGTYPDHGSHIDSPGCFRCHDDAHATPDAAHTIGQDCTVCHEVLAWDEEESDFITMLNLSK